jgi:cell wall assembly regulator SMI1
MGELSFVDTGPDLRSPDLDKLEELLGVGLPKSVREHYLKWNGGHPDRYLFHTDRGTHHIHDFLVVNSKDGLASFETHGRLWFSNEYFPKWLLPFAYDHGGEYFCVSIRPSDFGAVFFHDSEHSDDPRREVVFLAPTFDGFLTQLKAP